MQNHFYVYILKCKNGEYYIGHTDNTDQRMSEHNLGLIEKCYTQRRRPVKLMFLQVFSTRDDAFHAERQIKDWSRKKKEALMEEDWEKIKELNILQKKCEERLILQQVQDERGNYQDECGKQDERESKIKIGKI
jgi:putative endonuclease